MAQSIEQRITELRKSVSEYEKREVQLQTRLEATDDNIAKAKAKCVTHGIQPEQLDETIVKVEKQMNTLADSIEELLPSEGTEEAAAF